MRRRAVLAAVVAMSMLGLGFTQSPAVTAKGSAGNNLVAQLSGADEVPPVATAAHGTAHFHVSSDGTTVSYKVVVNKPSAPVVAAHIHRAPVGVNGPVVVPLFPAPNVKVNNNTTVFSGTFPMAVWPTLVADAAAGLLYVNVHTPAVPSGEIRGQLS